MEQEKHYYAFISHSSDDQKTALWLRNQLVNYHIPTSIQKEYHAPKRIRPVFLYQTDLAGNVLGEALNKELNDSQFLIVICSPSGAKSTYVNDEIQHFIDIGKADRIIPFIVDGKPHVENPDKECFPPALIKLCNDGLELRGIDFKAQSKQLGSKKGAVVNLIASLLGVRFDTMWDWHKRQTKKKRISIAIAAILIMLLVAAAALHFKHLEEQKTESQIITTCELASDLIDQGNSDLANRLLLSVMDLKTSSHLYPNKLKFLFRQSNQNRTSSWKTSYGYTNSALFSPDGNLIVSTSNDGSLSVWDAKTHDNLGTAYHQDSSTLRHAVNHATFSPDMRYIISASEDNTIKVWDAATLKEIRTLRGHQSEVLSTTFNHDQSLIASTAADGTIKIWETATYQEKTTLRHHKAVNSVVFSKDDQLMVSASDDSTAIVWDAKTFEKKQTLKGHSAEIDMVSISPDNRLIVSGGEDGSLKIWETSSGKCLSSIPSWSGINYSVEFSPDGQYILSSIVSMGNVWVTIYDAQTCRLIRQLPIITQGTAKASYSPDGLSIVISVFDKLGRVIVWDIDDGFEPHHLIGHKDMVYSAYYSHDGKRIVSASEDGTVRIWDSETLKEVRQLNRFNGPVLSAVFTPSDLHILSLTPDYKSQMWDIASGTEIPNYAKTVLDWSNAMSSDGLFVIDPMGNLINTQTMESKMLDQGMLSACVSHNGKIIATTSTTSEGRAITLWNNSGKAINTLTQEESITNLAFSHDDRYLATTSFDGVIYVWNLSAMQAEAVYKITQAPTLCAIEFNLDDSKIIYSNDSIMEIIDFPPLQELIDQTRERFKDRPLTPEERKMYYLE